MIVDFTVNGENYFTVVAYKRLLTAERVNNGKTFVAENCIIAGINAAPVRTAVTYSLGHFQNLRTQFFP